MKVLKNVQFFVKQDSHTIRFQWEPDRHNPDEYIYVFGLLETADGFFLDRKFSGEKNLNHYVGSIYKYTYDIDLPDTISEVTLKKFFLFSSDRKMNYDSEIERAVRAEIQKDPWACPYITDVVLGSAAIRYSVRRKEVKTAPEICSAVITLKTDHAIAKNIIGYRYYCGNTQIRLPIPFSIPGREKRFELPPVLIPPEARIDVIVYAGNESNEIQIQSV